MDKVWVAQQITDNVIPPEVTLSIHNSEEKAYEAAYDMIKEILKTDMVYFVEDPEAEELLEAFSTQSYKRTVELWDDDQDLITVECHDLKE